MRSAEQQCANPERQLSSSCESFGETPVDPGAIGIDDQPGRRDRELLRGVAVSDELAVMRQRNAPVHQDDDNQRVVGAERRGAQGRRSTPHDGQACDEHEGARGIGQHGPRG